MKEKTYKFDDSKKVHRIGVKKNKFTADRDPKDKIKVTDMGKGWPKGGYEKNEKKISDDSPSYEGEAWFTSKSFNDAETNKRPLHPTKDYFNPSDKYTGDDHVEMGIGNYYPEYKVPFYDNSNVDNINYDSKGKLNLTKRGGNHLITLVNEENAKNQHIYKINEKEITMGNLNEQIDRIKQMILFKEGMSFKEVQRLTEADKEGTENGAEVEAVSGGAVAKSAALPSVEGGEDAGEGIEVAASVKGVADADGADLASQIKAAAEEDGALISVSDRADEIDVAPVGPSTIDDAADADVEVDADLVADDAGEESDLEFEEFEDDGTPVEDEEEEEFVDEGGEDEEDYEDYEDYEDEEDIVGPAKKDDLMIDPDSPFFDEDGNFIGPHAEVEELSDKVVSIKNRDDDRGRIKASAKKGRGKVSRGAYSGPAAKAFGPYSETPFSQKSSKGKAAKKSKAKDKDKKKGQVAEARFSRPIQKSRKPRGYYKNRRQLVERQEIIADRIAKELHDCMDGMGTCDNFFEIIQPVGRQSLTSSEQQAIKDSFRTLYSEELLAWIEEDFSGDERLQAKIALGYGALQKEGRKVIKLKESDLYRIVERVIAEKKKLVLRRRH